MKNKIFAIVILVLVLSFFVVKSSFALYRNLINPNGSIATASWNVTLNQEHEDNNLYIVAGDDNSTASYTVNITSTSEVDIDYSIIVDDIPQGVKIKLDDGDYLTPTNHKIIYADIGIINYSDENKTKSHTVTFKADSNAEIIIDDEVNVNVKVKQVLNN